MKSNQTEEGSIFHEFEFSARISRNLKRSDIFLRFRKPIRNDTSSSNILTIIRIAIIIRYIFFFFCRINSKNPDISLFASIIILFFHDIKQIEIFILLYQRYSSRCCNDLVYSNISCLTLKFHRRMKFFCRVKEGAFARYFPYVLEDVITMHDRSLCFTFDPFHLGCYLDGFGIFIA